jgi:carbonic anhydrase
VGRPAIGATGAPKRGTLVTMLAAEAESVGEFAGSAIAEPLMLLGTLISVITFILASQPWLGVLVLGVVLPQAAIVTALQGRLNQRVRERVQSLRDASDRISDSDLARVEPEVIADFRDVFETERRIFLLKLSAKFGLTSITGAGAVGILFLGGWLVLNGRSDVGTVMASLTGLARIEGPWRELVGFFRNASTVRVKYAMLVRAITQRESMEGGAVDITHGVVPPMADALHDTTEPLDSRRVDLSHHSKYTDVLLRRTTMLRQAPSTRDDRVNRRGFLAVTGIAAATTILAVASADRLASGAALTKEQRDKLTPDDVVELMKQGNERFRLGQESPHDYLAQQKVSAKGQYPAAVILSCIDSRAPAETIMDLGIGDCFNARVAGNIANDDILGSMEFACKVAGAKVVLVMGHTACGAIKGAIDKVQLGKLTGLLAKIRPAVEATRYQGERSAKNYDYVDTVARKNVELTSADIRRRSTVLADLVTSGAVKIVGAMYNLDTGLVEFLG